MKAIVNFAISEHAIEMQNPFLNVYYDRAAGVQDRDPISVEEIYLVQKKCRELDDDIRWLISILSDSGMRLSEAAGLTRQDFMGMDSTTPHVVVRPYPWRSLKTRSSERVIPLVGASYWAASRILLANQKSEYAFPRYNKGTTTSANAASAALNKWMSNIVSDGKTLHGFRHSLRDRLRNVECPTDIVDQIGGWTTIGIGQMYGKGYPLKVLSAWMKKAIESVDHHSAALADKPD